MNFETFGWSELIALLGIFTPFIIPAILRKFSKQPIQDFSLKEKSNPKELPAEKKENLGNRTI
ncbi:hypothetical protein [Saccharibacillus qingshengii]|uniref:hypothetical protein n=1 Tax=Saccharibacillus qingshengii TaxID=1763540 RepID=UPI00155386D5|nr:hypothetical protein [Saccharibacillus qingshengii]